MAAGLTGWLATGSAGGHGPAAPPPSHTPHAGPSHAPGPASVRTVEVDGPTLVGQPVQSVRRQLRQMGLQPQVVWSWGGRGTPGTVASVRPSGRVRLGTAVTVQAVAWGHGGGQGHGQGHGQGQGGQGHGQGEGGQG